MWWMRQNFAAQFAQLLKRWLCDVGQALWWERTAPRCRRMPAAGVPFSVHLTGLLSVLLRCNVSLRFRELQGIRWAADHQTVTMTFFGASLALGSALELLLHPTAELVATSCHKIRILLHIRI